MKNYRVRTGCEVAGIWRATGEIIAMTEENARHLTPPFGRVLLPVDGQQEKQSDGGLDRRRRRRGKRPV